MGGQNNWRTNITFDDWSRDVEKRILSEERRPIIRSAADLMGPGAGPYAVQTDDWNADETTFNGWFYSEPGALNSPDAGKSWIGTTEGDPNGNGYELVRAYDPLTGEATGDSYVRFFSTPPGTGQRIYSDWTIAGGGGSGGSTPIGPAGGDLTGTYPNPTLSPAAKSGLMPEVLDEGTIVVADVTSLNFTGAGVTAGGSGGVATINIPGGGSGGGGGGPVPPVAHGEWATTNNATVADETWVARTGWSQRDVTNSAAVGVTYNGNGQFTVTAAGWHVLTFITAFAPSPVAPVQVQARLTVNGAVLNTWTAVPMNSSPGVGGAVTCWLPAGAVVTTQVWQSSTTSVACDTTADRNVFTLAALAQGAVGPAGGDLTGTYPNPSIAGVTFTFATAVTTWNLPHNLNKKPVLIYTTDNADKETYGDVTHVDANNATVTWAVPMTGFARVSA